MKPSYSVTRLTAYALISALEIDIRAIAREFLQGEAPALDLMGADLYSACNRRLVNELGEMANASLGDLLEYADFASVADLVAQHRNRLPPAVAEVMRKSAERLQQLAPVRNRVMHGRPLEFDDLALTLESVDYIVKLDRQLFDTLYAEHERLKQDPAVVLGLQIPPSPMDVRGPAHNLPIPDFDESGFVGRKDVAKQLLKLCGGPYPVITIVGEGGLGKTSLALKIAYELLESESTRFDAIIWTTCKTNMLTAQEIVRIDEAIRDSLGMFTDIATKLAGNNVAVVDPMEEILSYLGTFRILLILDNLETVLDARILDFVRRLPQGSKVLATSRIGMGAYEYPLKLERMSEGDSVQLLRAIARVRGADRLVKMSNDKLTQFCARMQHNPGWIKWFVAAAQAGKRPEDVLSNPKIFLEYCMSNVYEYLTSYSKTILEIMVGIPIRHGHADLAFLSNMDPPNLQRALQQLITTNMVSIVSTPTGATYHSVYEISEMARSFIRGRYPVDTKKLQTLNRRMQHLRHAEQTIAGSQSKNPFNILNVNMRTRGDIVPAKYLKDALDAATKKNYDKARLLIQAAQELAPDYYETFRIEAYVHELQGQASRAESAYEKALDLEPTSAPLHVFYGKCLVLSGSLEAALQQFLLAEQSNPRDPFIQLEKARTLLYLHRFDEGREILELLVGRDDLTIRSKINVMDTYFQFFLRKADAAIAQGDCFESLGLLSEMRKVYADAPSTFKDDKTRSRLRSATNSAMICVKKLPTLEQRRAAMELYLWFQIQSGAKACIVTDVDRRNNVIAFAPFRGKELRVSREDFINPNDWDRVKPGGYVFYCITNVESGSGNAVGVILV